MMWIRKHPDDPHEHYDHGDGRLAIVGKTKREGRIVFYWYIAAHHPVFDREQYDRPATLEEWRGTPAVEVASIEEAKQAAIKHLRENP